MKNKKSHNKKVSELTVEELARRREYFRIYNEKNKDHLRDLQHKYYCDRRKKMLAERMKAAGCCMVCECCKKRLDEKIKSYRYEPQKCPRS